MNEPEPPREGAGKPAKLPEGSPSAKKGARQIRPARGSGDHIRAVRETFGSHDNNLGHLLGPGARKGELRVMNPDPASEDGDEDEDKVSAGRRYIQGALGALEVGSTRPLASFPAPLQPSRSTPLQPLPSTPIRQRPLVGSSQPRYEIVPGSPPVENESPSSRYRGYSVNVQSRQSPSPQGYPVFVHPPYAPPHHNQPGRAQPAVPRYTRYYASESVRRQLEEAQQSQHDDQEDDHDDEEESLEYDESYLALAELHQLLAVKNERVWAWLANIDPMP